MIYYFFVGFSFIATIYYFYFLAGVLIGLKNLKRLHIARINVSKYLPMVSVIVPFRNEEKNILKCLRSLLAQNYPSNKVELIFIDDNSTDNSLHTLSTGNLPGNVIIKSTSDKYLTLSNKKRAVRTGIEIAKGEIIFTTDADCIHQINWLATMVKQFEGDTGFISGPVAFTENSTLFNQVQKLEFAGLVLTGAGLIGIYQPLICNAANIAYKKEAFLHVDGFLGNEHLASGDDEFLMQKIDKSGKYKVKFCYNKAALVETDANRDIRGFLMQRRRWASKGLYYEKKRVIFKLILIYFFFVSLIFLSFLSIVNNPFFLILLGNIIIIKLVIEFLILSEGKPLFYTTVNFKAFLIGELLHIPYIVIAGALGSLGNFVWKDRRLQR